MADIVVRVQAAPFDAAVESDRLRAGGVGALVTFTGICRDEGGRLTALEIEHYSGMAEAEIGRIAAEAAGRWPITGLTVIHRYGRIAAGDDIVLVVTAAGHREPALAAASFLMDYLKTSAPFWKKEHLANGGASDWISPATADDEAARRWR